MAARYLLDTNICIYVLSGRYPSLTKRIEKLEAGMAVMSVVVQGELAYGIAKSQRRKDAERRLEALEKVVTVVSMPPEAGDHYGDIRAQLEAKGTPIGANDLWIAAHARAQSLVVVTNNTREFKRVRGLKVENWV